jgi:putative CocE/NonD family hydrolase
MNRTLKTFLFATTAVTAAAAAGIYAAYMTRRRWIGQALNLPPAHYEVGVETHLRVPMPDGISLEAEHYYPLAEGSFPTILIRTPYGLSTDNPKLNTSVTNFPVQRFVERGYHVVVQSTRGRFGSEDRWVPFFNEAADGRATCDWISQQPWFNGSLGLFGSSYPGYTQWAIAADAPSYVKAMTLSITTSHLIAAFFPADGTLGLDTTARWMLSTIGPNYIPSAAGWAWLATSWGQDQYLREAFDHLPFNELDQIVTGHPIAFFPDWLEHSSQNDAHWETIDFRPEGSQVTVPVHLIAGWYDLFTRYQLADYQRLKSVGQRPYLTVGPTWHLDIRNFATMTQEGLAWFDAYLKNDPSRLRQHPVRIFVMGSNEWHELADWPPPAQDTRYFLHGQQQLAIDQPVDVSLPDRYVYDPGNPTPAYGGPLLSFNAGPHDQRALESRSDVLTYTTEPLSEDLEVIGAPRVELYVRSSLAHTDFVARLCDVQPDGRSINLCDGIVRLKPGDGEAQPDGSLKITIELWPTANCFQRGHRLRLQVCSGAHPRLSRNLGKGEPLATATEWQGAEQTIYHDAAHPSALILPVTSWWRDVADIEVLQYT